MLFFYIRHGDPIYNPDSLTPLGERQAEALTKRFAMFGLDKIYASTSERAKMTAKPTADVLKKEITELDFAREGHAHREFYVTREDGSKCWCFQDNKTRLLFNTPEVRALDKKWYEHPAFEGTLYKSGTERVGKAADEFFASLGYIHEPENNRYRIEKPSEERVALFAHQGFGMIFLSYILDIPYPYFSTHCNICHSGVTVIHFPNIDGYSLPMVLELSNDSHLWREGLPLAYNNRADLRF